MFFLFRIVIAAATSLVIFAQEPCTTTSGTRGKCISLAQCPPILTLLGKSSTDPETLRKSLCGLSGTTPKVCCPLESEGSTSTTFRPLGDRNLGLIPGPPDVRNHPNLKIINDKNCGPITETKIINGNKTGILEFPWMALISYNFERKSTVFLCGGTLISKRYVLTAAHCVTGLQSGLELSGVRIGDHDITKEIDCDYEEGVKTVCADKYQNFFFEKVHVHKGYRPPKLDNDIALIRLDSDAIVKPNVMPICLPVGNVAILNSDQVYVTGWGVTEYGHRSPDLLKVKLDITSNEDCAKVWRESNQVDVTYRQFCAGGKNGKDSCGGDSGGPLQFPGNFNGRPKYVQYGIVSFGTSACAIEGYPGVYTKVVYYMDWILDTITD